MTGVTGIQRNKDNRLGHLHNKMVRRSLSLFFTGFPSKLENDGAGRRKPPLWILAAGRSDGAERRVAQHLKKGG